MAYYALIDENNLVTQVFVGRDYTDLPEGVSDWETYYGEFHSMTCKETSTDETLRKNYAGIGYTYDEARDAFIPPRLYDSWALDEETCRWVAPVPYPEDGVIYAWNEELGDWESVQFELETDKEVE